MFFRGVAISNSNIETAAPGSRPARSDGYRDFSWQRGKKYLSATFLLARTVIFPDQTIALVEMTKYFSGKSSWKKFVE